MRKLASMRQKTVKYANVEAIEMAPSGKPTAQ